jgi:hypothetical protein
MKYGDIRSGECGGHKFFEISWSPMNLPVHTAVLSYCNQQSIWFNPAIKWIAQSITCSVQQWHLLWRQQYHATGNTVHTCHQLFHCSMGPQGKCVFRLLCILLFWLLMCPLRWNHTSGVKKINPITDEFLKSLTTAHILLFVQFFAFICHVNLVIAWVSDA